MTEKEELKDIKKYINNILKTFNHYYLSICNNDLFKDCFNVHIITSKEVKTKFLKLSNDEIKERIAYINYVVNAFNKINDEYKYILYEKYFNKNKNYYDDLIANNLNYSLGYYYVIKKRAIIQFAYALGY